jgi:hypothetical protein
MACDTPPTLVDQHFGMAVQRAQAQQSLLKPGEKDTVLWRCPLERHTRNCPHQHPHPHPHEGMGMSMHEGTSPHTAALSQDRLQVNADSDGATALSAVLQYQQSFRTPPAPAPVFNQRLGAVSAP